MKYFLILLTVILSTSNLRAQTAEDSVKAVINKMFTAMKNADGVSLKTCFADSVIFQTIARNKEGKTMIRNEDAAGFCDYISRQKAGELDEQIVFDVVRTDGPLAIAWTPYKFYAAGKFSHCGVNSFQLVRFNGEWKIQYLIDTRRRIGCE
jgi:hypothetical protein